MKIFKSLPNDQGFFDRYATLVPTLSKLGFFAQIVSAVTEIGILYALIFAAVAEAFPHFAPIAAGFGALVGTGFIEIGLRQFAPYSVRAVLHRRFSGLDLAMTVFIWSVTLALVFSSGFLSFKGSKEMVVSVAPQAKKQTSDQAEKRFERDQAAALDQWRADSLEIANRYQAQAGAGKGAFNSAIELAQTELRRLEGLERSGGQRYGTRKGEIRLKIKRLEAERDQAAATLQAQAAAEISGARKRYQATLGRLANDLETARGEVAAFNRKSEKENARKVRGWSGGAAWFTVVCLAVFLLSVAIGEIHAKGSGIEEKALPSPYQFTPGILAELRGAVNGKFQHFARSNIRRLEESTPPPPLPVVPAALYDLAGLKQYRYQIAINDQGATPTIYLQPPAWSHSDQAGKLESKALAYLQAAADLKATNPEAAAQMDLQAEDVLRAYLGPGATPQALADLKAAVISYLNKQGENPFAMHHRRPIGFHTVNVQDGERPKTVTVKDGDRMQAQTEAIDGKTRLCAHCGNPFGFKHWNARYCSDQCRIRSWEGRTGKKFKVKSH